MHAVADRNFPGRLPLKCVAFGSKWRKASGNRGHNDHVVLQVRSYGLILRAVIIIVGQFGNFCNLL